MNDHRALADRLKEDTKDLHTQAEKGPVQAALVQGRLPREQYVDLLGQMLLLHRALETHLRAHRDVHAAFRTVITDEQFQEPYLIEDLRFFGRDPETVEPTEGTCRAIEFIERTAATDPVALLGVQYVLEGANNGNRFIARVAAEAYQLEPGPGLRYLDPYGDSQREKWGMFRTALGAADFTQAQEDAIFNGAMGTFQAIINLHDGMDTTPDVVVPDRSGTPTT